MRMKKLIFKFSIIIYVLVLAGCKLLPADEVGSASKKAAKEVVYEELLMRLYSYPAQDGSGYITPLIIIVLVVASART